MHDLREKDMQTIDNSLQYLRSSPERDYSPRKKILFYLKGHILIQTLQVLLSTENLPLDPIFFWKKEGDLEKQN